MLGDGENVQQQSESLNSDEADPAVHSIHSAQSQSQGGAKDTFESLWDRFPLIIEKLNRTRSCLKELQSMFKSIHGIHRNTSKTFSRIKLDPSDMGFVKIIYFSPISHFFNSSEHVTHTPNKNII